jgi:hypothetical protein
MYGCGEIDITDVIICNIVAQNMGGESATAGRLSGMRVICQKAFGNLKQLEYDKQTTTLLTAMAKRLQPKQPKYSVPVDLGGKDGVLASIVRSREAVEHLSDKNLKKAEVIRNCTIFLERLDSVSRSDCETKVDSRVTRSFRVYNDKGQLLTQPNLSDQLDEALQGDGGTVQRNYLNPKDPRRKGEWSDTVETQPLRVNLLVDVKEWHLANAQRVGYLCSIRSRRDYMRCLEALDLVKDIPAGTTWTAMRQRTFDNKLVALKSTTISSLIKKRAEMGGLRVGTSDDHHSLDLGVGPCGIRAERLAGHFLRGHAGSLAYTLAVEEGASWDALLGVNRARHTLASFYKNYSRGVVPRMKVAFRNHQHKSILRFEEAARL